MRSVKRKLSIWHSDLQIKIFFELIRNCPNMEAIHIPKSYTQTISRSTQIFLEMQNIVLLEGDVWGHRKDINEYNDIKKKIANMWGE